MSEFIEGMADIFEVEPSKLSPATVLREYAWDSLAIVSTIALVDDCFGVMLEGEKLGKCETIGDIQALVEKAQAA